MADSSNYLVQEGLRALRRRLPPGWGVGEPQSAPAPLDATAELTAPGQRSGSVAIEVRTRLDPKGVAVLLSQARAPTSAPLVVVSRYLSSSTRQRLRERDVGYLDLTGNAHIVIAEPGLFIDTQGADEDPERQERPARSLRGPKAGRVVRALVAARRPPGVRELAAATKIDAGYVSRVLAFLDAEALITRVGRGRIESVDWPALLRRWAKDAPLESRGRIRTYLEPRGLPALLSRLSKSGETYAVTGTLAAASFAPLAPARLASIWVRDAAAAGESLDLRAADAGANVLLLEPVDQSVFDGSTQSSGIWYAAPIQVAVDLLTSPGRGPAEGEEVITWMQANEEAWRG
ncbi:MAG: hypothetical protein HY901_26445 [Deltaproteobacteria bacterium]|nr:hypothetical protein [Deltaproteobacteria bacterium]